MNEEAEEATSLLLRAQSCGVLLMMLLPRLPKKLINTFQDTEAGPNLICKSGKPQAYWEKEEEIKEKW